MSNDLMTRITALKKETASVWLGMRVESDQSELVTLIAKLTDIVQDMIAQMPPPPLQRLPRLQYPMTQAPTSQTSFTTVKQNKRNTSVS